MRRPAAGKRRTAAQRTQHLGARVALPGRPGGRAGRAGGPQPDTAPHLLRKLKRPSGAERRNPPPRRWAAPPPPPAPPQGGLREPATPAPLDAAAGLPAPPRRPLRAANRPSGPGAPALPARSPPPRRALPPHLLLGSCRGGRLRTRRRGGKAERRAPPSGARLQWPAAQPPAAPLPDLGRPLPPAASARAEPGPTRGRRARSAGVRAARRPRPQPRARAGTRGRGRGARPCARAPPACAPAAPQPMQGWASRLALSGVKLAWRWCCCDISTAARGRLSEEPRGSQGSERGRQRCARCIPPLKPLASPWG